MSVRADLLRRIEAFCRRQNITEATFGTRSVKDSRFVERLREGAATLRLIEKAEEYMEQAESRRRSAA